MAFAIRSNAATLEKDNFALLFSSNVKLSSNLKDNTIVKLKYEERFSPE